MAKAHCNLGYQHKGRQYATVDTSTPAVSVLMPVHNGGRFLVSALESVLAQTFADFELIAIDDGSDDGSAAVLAEFAAHDRRIHFYIQEHRGPVATLNRALALARAPIVARMDADNISRQDRFAKQIAHRREKPAVAAVSGAMDVIDQSGAYLRTDVFPTLPDAIKSELLHRSCVNHPAAMARRDVLRSIGGYRANAEYAAYHDLWLRISEVGEVANLADVLLSCRLQPVKASMRHRIAQELAVLAVRAAARQRRLGRLDPLEACGGARLGYRALQRMFASSVPRAEFALSFFYSVLADAPEAGSIGDWAGLYLRHGVWDLDRDGATKMMLLLGHLVRTRHRGGAPIRALAAYVLCAMVTGIRRPAAAMHVASHARYWWRAIRKRTTHSQHAPGAARTA